MASRKPSKRKLLVAIKQAKGNLSAVCRACGNIPRSTMDVWVKSDPDLVQAVEDHRQAMVDIAESALLKNVLAGDNCSIIFTLKTIGKNRGYVETRDHTSSDGSMTPKTITRIIVDPKNDDDATD